MKFHTSGAICCVVVGGYLQHGKKSGQFSNNDSRNGSRRVPKIPEWCASVPDCFKTWVAPALVCIMATSSFAAVFWFFNVISIDLCCSLLREHPGQLIGQPGPPCLIAKQMRTSSRY